MTSFLLLIFSSKITFGATEVIFMGNTGFFFFLRYHLALFNLDTDRKTGDSSPPLTFFHLLINTLGSKILY